jgi:hypothetical protein
MKLTRYTTPGDRPHIKRKSSRLAQPTRESSLCKALTETYHAWQENLSLHGKKEQPNANPMQLPQYHSFLRSTANQLLLYPAQSKLTPIPITRCALDVLHGNVHARFKMTHHFGSCASELCYACLSRKSAVKLHAMLGISFPMQLLLSQHKRYSNTRCQQPDSAGQLARRKAVHTAACRNDNALTMPRWRCCLLTGAHTA